MLEETSLDWSFMCPGILHASKGKQEHARVILEVMAVPMSMVLTSFYAENEQDAALCN